ncbi:phosphoribosyl 1,2-cyclic phosphate phosphodiesterase [Caulobacter ginsengisoli]|uniref:Phosphoribosyl 1,2-cyclic phosphate phosphodiesterase n=1 Tax=Caulobacter ginsengisoli TaxID=400775 RepID=A0ABU0IM59_9CAUL|nr:MBL fold metallo-hydrolase [Caulobacter ginsengisoli]MDQ0463098.1 phosphoribosyl 1,2-cyclic phosphate phosphodiesterase [Caulobacter ginsengisoli]
MSGTLEVTVLGCGSSGGVPRADGNWGDCDPAEPKNRRRRCSLLLRRLGEGAQTTVIVDTSPDFREQAIAAGIKRLDHILFTHDHADQTHGIDDVRAFFLNQRSKIPAHMDAATELSLSRKFGYIFEAEGGYPAICERRRLTAGQMVVLDGPSGAIAAQPFDVRHGAIHSLGFRFGPVAYIPDVDDLQASALKTLAGVEVLIVDALRHTPHPTHAHLARTLEWIAAIQPGRAILTNMHIDMDYRRLLESLPMGVTPAFDGMRLELDI